MEELYNEVACIIVSWFWKCPWWLVPFLCRYIFIVDCFGQCLHITFFDQCVRLFSYRILLIRSQGASDEGAKLNWYFWGVGFCGGFTTFASFVLLLVNGLMNASAMEAGIYATFSVLGGLLALVTGLIIGQKLLLKS